MRISIALFFLLMSLHTFGQVKDDGFIKKWWLKRQARLELKAKTTDNYFINTINTGISQVQDTRISPMIYFGPSIGIGMSQIEFKEKWISNLDLKAQIAGLSFEDSDNMLTSTKIELNYRLLKKTNWISNSISVGASIRNLAHLKLYPYLGNSAFNFDFIGMIDPSIRWQKTGSVFKRPSLFFIDADISGFGIVLRQPSYAFRGLSTYFTGLGQLNRLSFETGFVSKMKWSNENKFSLSYRWDFYSFNELNKLHQIRTAFHTISFSYWLKTR